MIGWIGNTCRDMAPSPAVAGEGGDGGVFARGASLQMHIDPIPAFPCVQGKGAICTGQRPEEKTSMVGKE